MMQEINDLRSIVNALQSRVFSLDKEVYRLELIESKFHLCIKHMYIAGMTVKEISRKIGIDKYMVIEILVNMRVKMRKE